MSPTLVSENIEVIPARRRRFVPPAVLISYRLLRAGLKSGRPSGFPFGNDYLIVKQSVIRKEEGQILGTRPSAARAMMRHDHDEQWDDNCI